MEASESSASSLRNEKPLLWPLALLGYLCLSVSIQGYKWIHPQMSASAFVFAFTMAILGGVMWAAIGGGSVYVGTTILHGRKGLLTTIRQVGVALVWPAVIALFAAAATFGLTQRGGILNYKIALVASTLRTLALIWAAVATVACIKMLHGFSWRRAIVAFLISFTIILLLTILVLFIVNIAHLIRGD